MIKVRSAIGIPSIKWTNAALAWKCSVENSYSEVEIVMKIYCIRASKLSVVIKKWMNQLSEVLDYLRSDKSRYNKSLREVPRISLTLIYWKHAGKLESQQTSADEIWTHFESVLLSRSTIWVGCLENLNKEHHHTDSRSYPNTLPERSRTKTRSMPKPITDDTGCFGLRALRVAPGAPGVSVVRVEVKECWMLAWWNAQGEGGASVIRFLHCRFQTRHSRGRYESGRVMEVMG